MRPGRPSRTAEGVAAIRAAEMILYPPERRVFQDPIAKKLLGPRMRLLVGSGPLLRALVWCHQRIYHGMVFEVLARARYAQENLQRLAVLGVRQVVVLGAGFDPTAWLGWLPEDLVVFELDDARTQALKRRRLASAGIAEPRRAVFVPIDLRNEDLAGALAAAGHRPDQRSFVTVLGVLPYLPIESVGRLLGGIARAIPPESETVYSYMSRSAVGSGRKPWGLRLMARRLERIGEPFLSGADPAEMSDLVERAGFTQVETLGGADLTERYFAPAGDPRTVASWLNLSRAVRR